MKLKMLLHVSEDYVLIRTEQNLIEFCDLVIWWKNRTKIMADCFKHECLSWPTIKQVEPAYVKIDKQLITFYIFVD